MKFKWKNQSPVLYLTIGLLGILSCIIIGISFYTMSITIHVPDFNTKIPTDNTALALTTAFVSFESVFDFIMPFMTTIIGIMTIALLASILIIGAILYFWSKDKKKMACWKEMGFACEKIEFLQGNRLKINQTELLLNRSQYITMQKLVNSRIAGEALHGIELGENATQIVKRLREELGSKLIEKTLIMNHRGKGYWIDIDPQRIKGIISP